MTLSCLLMNACERVTPSAGGATHRDSSDAAYATDASYGTDAARAATVDAALPPTSQSRAHAETSGVQVDAGVTEDGELERDASAEDASAAAWSRDEAREHCQFAAGALPEQTVDTTAALGAQIPIDHFIVVMQENHSFDHYFQMLPKRGQPDAEVAKATYTNPDPTHGGRPAGIFHETSYCPNDLEHGWTPIHQQYANGAMNGFLAASKGRSQALGYYDAIDLPYYYALANTFSIGDRYFSPVMGPTYPNRLFALSATSFGLTNNSLAARGAERHTIFQQLEAAGQPWMIYAGGQVRETVFYPTLKSTYPSHLSTLDQLTHDVQAGTLPALAWVESDTGMTANGASEHPPNDMQVGEQFVAHIVDALMHGPQWARTAIFITYDEHGGFFDHVPPPHACAPDSIAPRLPRGAAAGGFDRYGMRVPFIVVSPYARPHHVSHDVLSHTSILRLIQARYGLPALTRRDANANPPYDLFDFHRPAFLTAPPLPEATVNPQELDRCRAAHP
ncbi:MAG TPA: alkaline phosphatase family protein [Polyangiales bacterium]